jgi:hypothetical protein
MADFGSTQRIMKIESGGAGCCRRLMLLRGNMNLVQR